MKNYELQALRKLLMLSVAEAAIHLGKVTVRTWQYWESGSHAVPEYVSARIRELVEMRAQSLVTRTLVLDHQGTKMEIAYYHTIDEFEFATRQRNIVIWRLSQSIAVALYNGGK
ncbi:DUF1870 family protein [Klebsiella aerogenes]